MSHRSGRVAAAWAGALILLCAALGGCCGTGDEPVDSPSPEAAPVGAAEYERLLATDSGTALYVERLIDLSANAEARIEAEMNRLAAEMGSGQNGAESDWRAVFAELAKSSETPRDVDGVLGAYRNEVDRAAAFVAARDWVALPPEPPEVVEAKNRIIRESFPLALYMSGRLAVITPPEEEGAERDLANHCSVCVPPLAVHEAYPGHHVAFYHAAVERAGAELGDPVAISARPENFFFHEGWGLYAELEMLNAGYYDEPARELSAWRMILLRAARARLDAQIHAGEVGPEEAEDFYRSNLLEDPAAAKAEIYRHLARPTHKASYFVGLLQIQALRRQISAVDRDFSLKRFHGRLLRRPGRVPGVAREEFEIELAGLEPAELGL